MANNLAKALAVKLAPPDDANNLTRVAINCDTADVSGTVDQIEAVLYRRGDVFAHAGGLVEVREARATTVTEQQSGSTRMELFRLEGFRLAERVAKDCRARVWRKNTWQEAAFSPIVIATLESRGGGRAPTLTGIRSTPLVCLDGTLVDRPGYDGGTGVLFTMETGEFPKLRRYRCYREPLPKNVPLNGLNVPQVAAEDAARASAFYERETTLARKNAAAALSYLTDEVFAEFPFREPVDSHAAVAALLTALVRQVLDIAPAFLFSASQQSSGKTELMKLIGRVVEGTAPAMNQWAESAEERQKVVFSSLLAGRQYLMFDNLRDGAKLDCPIVAQLVTTGILEGRKLGASEMRQLPAAVFLAFSGNNVTPAEDMSSRVIEIYLAANMDRPDTRDFRRDLGAWVDHHRPEVVEAALKIIVAYLDAGAPRVIEKASRFQQWDRMVRSPIIFAGGEDVAAAFDRAHDADPTLELLRDFLNAWQLALGEREVTTAELLDVASDFKPELDGFKQALNALTGDGRQARLSVKSTGMRLKRFVNRTLDGLALRDTYDNHRKLRLWRVEQVQAPG